MLPFFYKHIDNKYLFSQSQSFHSIFKCNNYDFLRHCSRIMIRLWYVNWTKVRRFFTSEYSTSKVINEAIMTHNRYCEN